MEMTIEEAIKIINHYLDYPKEEVRKALLLAIDTMRKYQQLQADYETRLKADMVAILKDLQLEIEEKGIDLCDDGWYLTYNGIIQERINKIKDLDGNN